MTNRRFARTSEENRRHNNMYNVQHVGCDAERGRVWETLLPNVSCACVFETTWNILLTSTQYTRSIHNYAFTLNILNASAHTHVQRTRARHNCRVSKDSLLREKTWLKTMGNADSNRFSQKCGIEPEKHRDWVYSRECMSATVGVALVSKNVWNLIMIGFCLCLPNEFSLRSSIPRAEHPFSRRIDVTPSSISSFISFSFCRRRAIPAIPRHACVCIVRVLIVGNSFKIMRPSPAPRNNNEHVSYSATQHTGST